MIEGLYYYNLSDNYKKSIKDNDQVDSNFVMAVEETKSNYTPR